jgi:hypothetical protein
MSAREIIAADIVAWRREQLVDAASAACGEEYGEAMGREYDAKNPPADVTEMDPAARRAMNLLIEHCMIYLRQKGEANGPKG